MWVCDIFGLFYLVFSLAPWQFDALALMSSASYLEELCKADNEPRQQLHLCCRTLFDVNVFVALGRLLLCKTHCCGSVHMCSWDLCLDSPPLPAVLWESINAALGYFPPPPSPLHTSPALGVLELLLGRWM